MVAIVITSHGTLGDNLPLVALGQALKERGYRVLMAIGEPMHPYALKAGLEVVSHGRLPIGQEEAQEDPQSWNHLSGNRESKDEEISEMFWEHLVEGVPAILAACREADLLISTPQQDLVAAIAHEKLGIPWISASVTPSLHCLKRKQSKTSHTETDAKEPSLGEQMRQMVQQMRLSLDLAELTSEQLGQYHRCDHLILASSAHFSQPTVEYSQAVQTGFWFYEAPDWSSWQPESNLRKFMEQEPKPLVLSFSSQPLEDSRSVVEVHVRAAANLGHPILIQQGWADFNQEHLPPNCDRDQVMFAGFMPQDWLFARAAALIHHGGIGTTARALRNGCPMLVEPYGNDQFFNAKQIVLHGIGAAMHPMHLRVEEVTRVLQEKVLTPDYKQRAETLSSKIQQETGLEMACNLIESWL